jgi:cation transport ATPase
VWAGLYNAVTMPIAAGVLYPALKVVAIPPGFAGLSELLSSVPVVLGSLALFWWSPPKPPPAEPPARRGDAAVALEVRAPR